MDDLRNALFRTRLAVRAVAKECDISAAAVSQWRKSGIPANRRAAVEKVLAELTAEPVTAELEDAT